VTADLSRSVSRRRFGTIGLGIAAGLAVRGTPLGAQSPSGDRPIARVIVDNDFAGDPDGLLALAYQLAAPTTRTVLVTASALDAHLAALVGKVPAGRTAAAGAAIAADLVRRARPDRPPPVLAGAETFGAGSAQFSPAARAIVAEANRPDPLPLFITCGGPLTNVAAALRLDPGIARRLTLIWIGGRSDPAGGTEYNLATDLAAARHALEVSEVPVWQVPMEAYSACILSHAELAADLRPISPLTQWLYEALVDLPSFVPRSGVKGIGDCAMVPLASVSPDAGRYAIRPVRRLAEDLSLHDEVPGRTVRRYDAIDTRTLVGDLLATLRLRSLTRT
jgi:hypothetical protein